MKLFYSTIIAFLFTIQVAQAQYAGAQVSFGISSMSSEHLQFTPEATAHYGYSIGIDARLNDGLMYFNPGLYYYKMSLIASDGMDFFGHEYDVSLIKGRMGLGFIIDASRIFKPRFKINVVINYVYDVTDPNPLDKGLDEINSTLAANVGIGADISVFTIDFDYEKGISNGLKNIKDSKIGFMTFSVGIRF